MFDLEAGRPALKEPLVGDIEEDRIARAVIVMARVGGEGFRPCLFGVLQRPMFHRPGFGRSECGSRRFSQGEADRGTKEPEKAKGLAREFMEER